MGRTYTTDVLIIGAGAAGIMAALNVKHQAPQKNVILLEGSFAAGRKILVSGGGRCNLYNKNLESYPEDHYYDSDKKLLRSIFNQYGYDQIRQFFFDLGIATYVETKLNSGKVFPITDQAKNVLELLLQSLSDLGVKLELNSKVISIMKDEKFKVQVKRDEGVDLFVSDKLILAAGGKTYPALGADGSGFQLAHSLGHSLYEPVVAAVPLSSKDQICQTLQGVKVQAGITLLLDGKELKSTTGDLLFTKYGVSGSAILNISRDASIIMNRQKIQEMDLMMDFVMQPQDQFNRRLLEVNRLNPGLKLPYLLYGSVHYKLANFITRLIKSTDKKFNELELQERERLLNLLTGYKIKINGTRGWNEAEFTSGGVDTAEVDPKSLESKIIKDLFLCGEILNVDGEIGGYNLSWAWASGAVAGQSAGLLS